MGDPTTCVYQLIYYENHSDDTNIIQYFIMHGLVLYIKVDSYLAHIFYVWSFNENKTFPVPMKKNKYFTSLNINNTVFAWGDGNSNKNITHQLDSFI